MSSLGAPRSLARFTPYAVAAVTLGVGGIAATLTQIVCVRVMEATETGTIVFCLGLLSVISVAGATGIPQLVARFAAKDDGIAPFRAHLLWSAFTSCGVVGVVVVVATAGAGTPIANLTMAGLALLSLTIACRGALLVDASYRRARGQLAAGAAVQQWPLLAVPIGLALQELLGGSPSPTSALLFLSSTQLVLLVGFLGRELADPARSSASVWLRERRDFRVPLAAGAALGMAFVWTDRLIVGTVLPTATLADYQTLVLTTVAFDFAAIAIGFVNLPRYARSGMRTRSDVRLTRTVAAASLAATLIFGFTLAPIVFTFTWNAETVASFLLLTCAGVAKVIYFDVSAAVGGAGSATTQTRYIYAMTATLLVGAVLTIALTLAFGFVGASVGAAAIWIMRASVGMGSLRRGELVG